MTKPPPSFFSAAHFAPITPDEARKYTMQQSAPWLEVGTEFAPRYSERYKNIKPER